MIGLMSRTMIRLRSPGAAARGAAVLLCTFASAGCRQAPTAPEPPVEPRRAETAGPAEVGAAAAVCLQGRTWDHDGDPATPCRAVSSHCAAGTRQTRAPGLAYDRACDPGTFCAGGVAPARDCLGDEWDHDSDASTACVARGPEGSTRSPRSRSRRRRPPRRYRSECGPTGECQDPWGPGGPLWEGGVPSAHE